MAARRSRQGRKAAPAGSRRPGARERRAHPRYELELNGSGTVISVPARAGRGEEAFDSVSADVSLGGLKIRTPERVRPGDRVRLHLDVPGRRRPMGLDAVVRWAERGGDRRTVAGLAFLDHVSRDNVQALLDLAAVPTPGVARGTARQVNLPLRRAVEISVRSLKIRFWRSTVTSAVVFLAVAFFVYMLSVEPVKAELEVGEVIVKSAGAQRAWVAAISLLVAVVGITNTLHMSVAERYREIGTMKCLGALDRFVVELFILESMAMGAIGSVVGSVIGTLLAVMPWVFRVKELAAAPLPLGALGANVLWGVGVGLALTVFGSLYPAFRAARMPPAEAMRTEV